MTQLETPKTVYIAGVEPVGYTLKSRMENTLGLNVHGSTASQPESQPNDTSNPIASSHVQWNMMIMHLKRAMQPSQNQMIKARRRKVKMSPQELTERMEKIWLQNEKIEERHEHVKADKQYFCRIRPC